MLIDFFWDYVYIIKFVYHSDIIIAYFGSPLSTAVSPIVLISLRFLYIDKVTFIPMGR